MLDSGQVPVEICFANLILPDRGFVFNVFFSILFAAFTADSALLLDLGWCGELVVC